MCSLPKQRFKLQVFEFFCSWKHWFKMFAFMDRIYLCIVHKIKVTSARGGRGKYLIAFDSGNNNTALAQNRSNHLNDHIWSLIYAICSWKLRFTILGPLRYCPKKRHELSRLTRISLKRWWVKKMLHRDQSPGKPSRPPETAWKYKMTRLPRLQLTLSPSPTWNGLILSPSLIISWSRHIHLRFTTRSFFPRKL